MVNKQKSKYYYKHLIADIVEPPTSKTYWNIAARIVSRCSRDIDSEDVLQSLNWLRIKYRITFKVLLIVYKCVNDLAPKYLSDLFIPYKKDRTVRNNFKHLLDCPENRDAKS